MIQKDDYTNEQWEALLQSAHQIGHQFEKQYPNTYYDEKTTEWHYENNPECMDKYDKDKKLTKHFLPILAFIQPAFY